MTTENASIHSNEQIKSDVRKLADEVRLLETYTTAASLIGAAIGSIVAIPLGPVAFLSGTLLGAAATGGIKIFARSKKSELAKQVESLQEAGAITSAEAAQLTAKLGAIHTDNPEKLEASASVSKID